MQRSKWYNISKVALICTVFIALITLLGGYIIMDIYANSNHSPSSYEISREQASLLAETWVHENEGMLIDLAEDVFFQSVSSYIPSHEASDAKRQIRGQTNIDTNIPYAFTVPGAYSRFYEVKLNIGSRFDIGQGSWDDDEDRTFYMTLPIVLRVDTEKRTVYHWYEYWRDFKIANSSDFRYQLSLDNRPGQ